MTTIVDLEKPLVKEIDGKKYTFTRQVINYDKTPGGYLDSKTKIISIGYLHKDSYIVNSKLTKAYIETKSIIVNTEIFSCLLKTKDHSKELIIKDSKLFIVDLFMDDDCLVSKSDLGSSKFEGSYNINKSKIYNSCLKGNSTFDFIELNYFYQPGNFTFDKESKLNSFLINGSDTYNDWKWPSISFILYTDKENKVRIFLEYIQAEGSISFNGFNQDMELDSFIKLLDKGLVGPKTKAKILGFIDVHLKERKI